MYDYIEYTVYNQLGQQLLKGQAKDDRALASALVPDLSKIVHTIQGPAYVHIKEMIQLQSMPGIITTGPTLDTFKRAFIQFSNGTIQELTEAEIDQFINDNIRPVDLVEIDGFGTVELAPPQCQHPNKRFNQFQTFSFYFCPECKKEVS